MTIISDTTPIISLIKINRLDLLEKLFEEVLIPEAVYRELTTNALFENEAKIVKTSSFLKTSFQVSSLSFHSLEETSFGLSV